MVVVDWKREDGIYCWSYANAQLTLSEAQRRCIQDEHCTGVSSTNCRVPNAKFELCTRQSTRDPGFWGCWYTNPGNVLDNYLNYFLSY